MNLHQTINELAVIGKTYADFVTALIDAGWQRHGTTQERFLCNPYQVFGASRYFMKDDQLYLVSTSLNIRDGYGLPNIVNISERNLVTSDVVECDSINLPALHLDYAKELVIKYKAVKAVKVCVMDNEDDMAYFMGLTGDGRALFESRSDEDRLRPVHETQKLVAITDCEYKVESLDA